MKNLLPVGTLVTAEIVSHQRWGVDVRLLTPVQNVVGLIDVLYVTNERPFEPFIDYPAIGSQVKAVVVAHAPNGQLRLSTRNSDVDPALEQLEDS
jgi:hypothetical protein